MSRFAANLSFLYTEWPFLERFAAAAEDGFEAVEFLFPYDFEALALARALRASGLEQALFNLPAGDWAKGERGLAALSGREGEFDAGLELALDYALSLGCRRLHAMAGLADPGDATAQATYLANLRRAARRLAPHGIELMIEPINQRDMPGYFLRTQAQAVAVIEAVAEPNLRLQMDCYHCQISEGDLLAKLAAHFDCLGHVQIAGVPLRHEPDEGEVNYGAIFKALDGLGYGGWIGCEYRPRASTREGLGWLSAARVK